MSSLKHHIKAAVADPKKPTWPEIFAGQKSYRNQQGEAIKSRRRRQIEKGMIKVSE